MSNIPGIGPGRWDKHALARAQELAALAPSDSIVFRLYTEDKSNLTDLVARYFAGATLYLATGLWKGSTEQARIIEIVGTLDDLQSIVHLAGDIKERNHQSSVLITYQPIKRLDV